MCISVQMGFVRKTEACVPERLLIFLALFGWNGGSNCEFIKCAYSIG
jgi:hypothetical protein